MTTVVGISRKSALSPGAHRANDAAILGATLARLASLGWAVKAVAESAVEAGDPIPPADLYLNMCQGRDANLRLLSLEADGARIVNRPSSALGCHRVRLVERFRGSDIPFAPSLVVRRGDPEKNLLAWLATERTPDARVWLKRGDVHAEGPDDVRAVRRGGATAALRTFFDRSIESVIAQHHLEGPLEKFYGVGTSWFRSFAPEAQSGRPRDADASILREIAFGAARLLGLEVFGGDAIWVAPGRPVLIDVNDWPSFARFRVEAAAAIALHVDEAHPARPARAVAGERERVR